MAVGDYSEVSQTLAEISTNLSAPLIDEPDGFARVWIEQRQVKAVRVEELLTISPAVVREKHRSGWDKTWNFYHASHEQLTLLM
ncbi:MAG TPA: hypothetical protein V6D18_19410 [Thermosynechococcaceae cyanobacterium]